VSPEAPEGAREGYSKGRHAQVVRKTELAKTEVVAERPYSERLPTLGALGVGSQVIEVSSGIDRPTEFRHTPAHPVQTRMLEYSQ
jgi:hypothetical protein